MIIIIIKVTEVIILIILSLISDIRTYKIKNKIVFPFMIIGFLTNFFLDGFSGLVFSFKGFIAPIVILMIFFALRMIGAGDIKLFSAIGAIFGIEFAIYNIVYSFLAGGVIAILLLAVNKNGIKRLRYLFKYLKACFISASLLPYTDFQDKSDKAKFHFAYAIAVGTFVQLIIKFCI